MSKEDVAQNTTEENECHHNSARSVLFGRITQKIFHSVCKDEYSSKREIVSENILAFCCTLDWIVWESVFWILIPIYTSQKNLEITSFLHRRGVSAWCLLENIKILKHSYTVSLGIRSKVPSKTLPWKYSEVIWATWWDPSNYFIIYYFHFLFLV